MLETQLKSPVTTAASEKQLRQCFVHWMSTEECETMAISLTQSIARTQDRIEANTTDSQSSSSSSPSSSSSSSSSSPCLSRDTIDQSINPGSSSHSLKIASSSIPIVNQISSNIHIKQFYFPNGIPLSPTSKQRESDCVTRLFNISTHDKIDEMACRELVRDVCSLPSYISTTLFSKLQNTDSVVTKLSFHRLWQTELQTRDVVTRLFRILRHSHSDSHLDRNCFRPLLQEVVTRHPGLDFLSSLPSFQEKYIETVIARIFYTLDRTGNNRISLGELKRSNLLSTLFLLETEDDINEIFDFFSYEHFYVIYCKFWELDEDHDFFLTRTDLAKYANFALTPIVIQRIFDQCARPFLSHQSHLQMSLEDFIVFLLSEEDKSSETALDYWFGVCDLDSDGCLSVFELEAFYCAQNDRIQTLSHEHVSLNDYMCQIFDIVEPATAGLITRQDLKRCKLIPVFFNMLFNLEKFIQYESRDVSLIEQVRSTPRMSDWDRFACIEYGYYANADAENNSDSMNSGGDALADALLEDLEDDGTTDMRDIDNPLTNNDDQFLTESIRNQSETMLHDKDMILDDSNFVLDNSFH